MAHYIADVLSVLRNAFIDAIAVPFHAQSHHMLFSKLALSKKLFLIIC